MIKKIVAVIMVCSMFVTMAIPIDNKAEASSVSYKYVNVDYNDKLNMRKNPNPSSKIISRLSNNAKVEVIDKEGTWSKIEHDGKEGFVNNKYISNTKNTVSSEDQRIVEIAKDQIGKPYAFGASGPNSFDCSGFVYYVMNKSGKNISRKSSAGHWYSIDKVKSPEVGDVVFLKNTYIKGPSHMGIYIGNGNYINAKTSGTGVKVDSLYSSYTQQHLLGFGRF